MTKQDMMFAFGGMVVGFLTRNVPIRFWRWLKSVEPAGPVVLNERGERVRSGRIGGIVDNLERRAEVQARINEKGGAK